MKNYVLALLLTLPALVYAQVRETPLEKVLIPYDDPVESGMTAAAKQFLFLHKQGSEGYWRFVEACEKRLTKGVDQFRGQGWAFLIASTVAQDMKAQGVNPLTPREGGSTELAEAVKAHPFLFNPTSDLYLDFYRFATGMDATYETVPEAMLAYRAMLAVQQEKRIQKPSGSSSGGLAQFHADREAAEEDARSRRAAANAQTGANAARSQTEAQRVREAAASATQTRQSVTIYR